MPYQKPDYKKYRVKSAIKSFRDLEVYRQTTQLCVEIYQILIPKQAKALAKEFDILKDLAKPVPKLIAESYGDKFSSFNLAVEKLEQAMRLISNIIAKLDFLIISLEEPEIKENLNKILKKYQIQRVKILNLERAWKRVFGNK